MGEWANQVCGYCGEEIRWVSPPSATGYWVHGQEDGYIYCLGRNTRAIPKGQVIPQPLPFVPNDGIDYPQTPVDAGPLLEKIVRDQKATQTFYDSGLLWLVNAAILWPRGYALTVSTDEDGRVLDLWVTGDGMEPIAPAVLGGEGEGFSGKFKLYVSDQAYRHFCEFEREREANPPIKVVDLPVSVLASGMSVQDIKEIEEAFNGPKIESQPCTGNNDTCGIEVYYDNRTDLFRNVYDDRPHTCDEVHNLPTIENTFYRVGDRVRLTRGPWEGSEGVVIGYSGHEKYPLEVELDRMDVFLPICADDGAVVLV